MDKVRVGIIGIGNIGSAHLASVAGNKVCGLELGALCDIDSSVRERLRISYGDCPIYTNYKELIDSADIDAVIISVPHRFHGEIAEYALSSGKHVLVEKPVDISVARAQKLNDTARKSDCVFAIMFNQRTNPLFRKARDIIRGGLLGNLKRSIWIITNWYRTQAYYDSGSWRATWAGEGGGVMLNQAPHNIDLWQWICGMPSSVIACCDIGKYHSIEVEDDVTLFARYPNGATGTFITSTGENPGTNRFEVSGELGKIVLEKGMLKWWKLKQSERKFCYETDLYEGSIDFDYEEYTFDSNGGNHLEILQNFSDAILEGKELIAPGTEGINELMISNAAYLSQWKGNLEINLPFDTEEFEVFLADKIKNSKYHTAASKSANDEYKSRWSVQW